jgi:hypothetical protein
MLNNKRDDIFLSVSGSCFCENCLKESLPFDLIDGWMFIQDEIIGNISGSFLWMKFKCDGCNSFFESNK